ncbi:hypothetical protein B5E41_30120 [Rhizobium esperanzae]|uniref:Uncharacterized protein n=1 Tax=Rhizobium esperanzae TaxID=1967781 RepID=A0A246DKN5_9HYPH|nr:hypothetical protein [Rhizobium esperanzae]OWO89699.1 hypothetical protein B5E41_30120 [Rhizobium esperanzae]
MSDTGKWFEQKARLAEKGLLHELFTQLDDITFTTSGALYFEPLLIADHSTRLAELLDRCLSMRKDVRELEVLAFKAASDYALFINTSAIDERMDILRLQAAFKAEEQKGFRNAVGAFDKTSTLEKGLSEVVQGLDAALGEDLTSSTELKHLIETRWEHVRDYQKAYHDRYCEPGNAHNYGERATTLLGVLKVLLDEALARASALAAGIYIVYGAKIADVPASVNLQTLDQFAMWAFRTIRSLSNAAEQETTFEIVIPLVQPWLSGGKPLITKEKFNDQISKAALGKPLELNFDLPHNDLLDGRVRLRSLGISFGNKFARLGTGIDANQTADLFTRVTVKITTPDQIAEAEKSYHRPDVVIGNVGLHGAAPLSPIDGSAVENLCPFGKWKITIHPLVVWKDADSHLVSDEVDSDRLRDFKLAFRFYVPGPYTMIPANRQ